MYWQESAPLKFGKPQSTLLHPFYSFFWQIKTHQKIWQSRNWQYEANELASPELEIVQSFHCKHFPVTLHKASVNYWRKPMDLFSTKAFTLNRSKNHIIHWPRAWTLQEFSHLAQKRSSEQTLQKVHRITTLTHSAKDRGGNFNRRRRMSNRKVNCAACRKINVLGYRQRSVRITL